MGLKEVRENIVENFEKRKEKVDEENKISEDIKIGIKMAKSYLKKKNYSASFFMFFRALKLICLLYLIKQHGKVAEISELDALFFVSKKDGFPFNEEMAKEFLKKFDLVLSRKELERKDCIEIKKIVEGMGKKIGI
jgi:HEPN domain-containing protein